MEHLRELRNRLVIALAAVLVGVVVGFIVFDPVWAFIKEPFCETPQAGQLRPGECTLIFGGIFQSFFLTLKVSALVGIVVSSPVWLYQIWAFVTPALYRNEKRYSFAFLGIAVPLFLLGTALAYFIMDTSLAILLGFAPTDSVAAIQIDEYVSYVLIMLVIFGISFELPLLLVFLNIVGVLSHATVKKHRRTVIFVMFIFGAVITPGGDPLTMMALAMPMVVLYFVAEGVMYLRERRMPNTENFSHLSDDEASPLAEDTSSLDDDPTPLDEEPPAADKR
ncbi:sec-independent protein translocase protein TatC [Nonomuraea thailandensis]|uniref:Sec-independent protein translocase protein TatC n=1 Tax=Nonomuraea thailandensis TaxID=1188745 RepID=A0A9X2GDL1_9ACTN|nr:twin-arginine translocase subunit TatC [Nonomuraea thailandensis]MCP2355444.1 sec-independent protein translocase protein TatC [Nonomuraea thailandensis]